MLFSALPTDENILEHLRPLLERVEETTHGEWCQSTIIEMISAQKLSLLAAVKGGDMVALAGLVTKEYRNGTKVGRIPFVVGQKRKDWIHLIGLTKKWMIDQGCNSPGVIEMRPGWERDMKAHGFKVTHVVAEMELS